VTDKWQGGKTYVPGSLVVPTAAQITQPTLTNPDFESGDTGWERNGGTWSIDNVGTPYHGAWDATCTGSGELLNPDVNPVAPGTLVSASCAVKSHGITGTNMQVMIVWYDKDGARLTGKEALGNGNTKHDTQQISSVTMPAPAGAASFRIGAKGTIVGAGGMGTNYSVCDYFAVSCPQSVPKGLIFKATQAAPGKSGSAEPTWPLTTGVPVTDNEVIWEGVIATRLVWQAVPLLKSGDTEPAWPTSPGGAVHDGTIDWVASSAQITDPNCPQSKIVAIAAGKVYAADDDIIRYCATVNPLDWTSTNNAGYLPFGLQTYGANPVAAMNLYRSNLVPFNAEGFQMWQVDPDPANTSLLDALPVATIHNKALAPVANDLLFLSSQGVRSIGIAASSTNLQAGDVGMPIDVLVKAAMRSTVDEPRATFLPALGQYWIAFNAADRTSCTVFVYTLNQIGQVGKWSRYVFPFPIDDFMLMDDQLYLRSNDDVLLYDDTVAVDFAGDVPVEGGTSREAPFPGIVQYQWLDFGRPGVSKQVAGFDLVGSGNPTFALGYDQSNEGTFTTDFAVPADSVPGMMIPLPVMAPSLSVRVSYPGGQKWQLQAVSLYLQDQRTGT
jgi:hypothetical protein